MRFAYFPELHIYTYLSTFREKLLFLSFVCLVDYLTFGDIFRL